MSDRDESLSTRDLASTPAEDTGRTTDRPEEAGTEQRDEAVTTAVPPGDAQRAMGDERAVTGAAPAATGAAPAETGDVATAPGREEPVGDATDERGDEDAALLPEDQASELQGRWESIQTTFVDDPRDAVETADALVAELMQRLADGFARERERLEGQWSRGEDVSTEDLRVVLQRYRSFFRRLLSA
jgi:hypothetical protein